jgi:hypothetical protein
MSALWQAPILLLAVLGWLSTPPKTMVEAAQREAIRRQLVGKPQASLTNIGLPPEIPLVPPAPPAVVGDDQAAGASADKTTGDKATGDKLKDEQWWRDRLSTANDRLKRDQMMGEALQTRVNTLKRDSVNLDTPSKQRKAREELQSTLDELDRTQKQIEQDRKAIQDIQDDGRKVGVPAGWIR